VELNRHAAQEILLLVGIKYKRMHDLHLIAAAVKNTNEP
jgi:hypothetical protein